MLNSARAVLLLAIAAVPSLAQIVITTPSPLPTGVEGITYSQTFAAINGSGTYLWSVTGNVPPGLSINPATGELSGDPLSPSTYIFTVTALSGNFSGSKQFQLKINSRLFITTDEIFRGQVGVPFNRSLTARGGETPYMWVLRNASSLPSGLTLNPVTGAITGTPAGPPGQFFFDVTVSDTAAPPQTSFTLTAEIQIAPAALAISTTSPLPAAVQGRPYTQSLAATGGTLPFTWSLAAGSLPPGIGFSPAGVLSGTLLQSGPATFTVRLVDSGQPTQSATRTFSMQVVPPVSITTGSPLPPAQATTPYAQQLVAAGGTPPYGNWIVAGGALPPGLTLSSGGAITGAPSAPGNFSFTVRVQDSTPLTTPNFATKTFDLQVTAPPITITTGNPLPGAEPGSPYNLTLIAQGGITPYAWSIQSGSLPPGLALSGDGLISGEIGNAGDYSFVIRVRDAANASTAKSFILSVATVKRPFEIGTTSLPDGTTGVFYASSVFARGGSSPYTFSMTGLPPGVQSNAAGNIDGTPTRAGTYTVRVSATDSDRAQASATLTIVIKPGQIEIFTISIPEGRVDASYSTVFGARGGVPTYSWALSGGTLPSGLSLNASGELSGTPAQAGSFTFTVQATDQEKQSGVKSFTLVIRAGLLTITTTTLPNGTAGSPYSASLAATGGTKPYKWSLGGGVPAGLSINADSGDLAGTPTTAGTYTLSAQVGDADSLTSSKPFTIAIARPLVITTTSPLPSFTAGAAGSAAFSATGGVEPYTWSITSGPIPAGMNFAAGQLTGTPTAAGTFSFTVQVTDANRTSSNKAFTLEVLPVVMITTDSLPVGTSGTMYSGSLTATGGVPPYRWSATGALPPGLTVDESGAIAGRPTAAGTYSFSVQVRDSAQPTPGTSSRSLTIVVALPQISGVNIGGLPANAGSAQQPRLTLTIGSPFPLDVSGVMTLTFVPDAANNADDPAIQFSTGGRTAAFTIPAGQTQAVFRSPDFLLQTGTVAGTIAITTSLIADGATLTCSCSLVQSIRIARTAPVISNVRVSRTANGFNLIVTGFSSTREITRGVFRFSGTSSLQTNEVILPLTDLFNPYYRGTGQFGGQFVLTAPFVIQGQAGDVTSVSIILSNTVGDSQASTASL